MRKNAESEFVKLKEDIARTQYIDEIRQRELYQALVLKNNKPEYFHTITEKIRDAELIPSFNFTNIPNQNNYEDYRQPNDIENILTNSIFFLPNSEGTQNFSRPKLKNKASGINLDDFEVLKANEYRLEALETGNPRDELERMDKELFNFFKKREETDNDEEDNGYHRFVDPLLNKIKYPERYDKDANKYI